MTITFSAPPINEVVVGKIFQPLSRFLIPYYGRFWELVQEEFPTCEHAPLLVEQGSQPQFDVVSGSILPRVWFVSDDKTRLLQVQSDRFHCNWRQTDGTQTYIRFETIYSAYQKYVDLFRTFLLAQLNIELVTHRCDLSYINVFRKGKEWDTWSDLSGLFKKLSLPADIAAGKIQGALTHLQYGMANGSGTVTVSIGSAKIPTGEDAIRMELTASSSPKAISAAEEDAWFRAAHEAIVQSFCELTTDRAQQTLWKRIA
jgi:uncharacterized protein (TIGR04255 family)